MKKEELIRDEDYSEEEAEIMILKNKLDKANERIEVLENTIKYIKVFITNDIKVNKRCLQEQTTDDMKMIMKLWLKYDNKLLDLLKEEK